MVLRTGSLTRQQWANRIHELLEDIGKEGADYADSIFEMLVDMALEIKDERQDEEDIEFPS